MAEAAQSEAEFWRKGRGLVISGMGGLALGEVELPGLGRDAGALDSSAF